MISIALALILILGINSVFKYTTAAVGQGQAVNAATRDSRAAQTVFSSDFAAVVPNGTGSTDAACIILRSSAIAAFRDRADESSDNDGNKLTIDIDGNGKEGESTVPGEIISPATYNFRNHRIDTLSFFARNLFRRQTGNPGIYAANMASQEAWIWYGHLWLPTNNSSSAANMYPTGVVGSFPGYGNSSTNPNNYYATQFVLGRVAMLLREPTGGILLDNNGIPQSFVQNISGYGTPVADLQPLDVPNSKTQSINDASNRHYSLYESRLDLAATSISNFRGKLLNFLTGAPLWWDYMMDGNPIAADPHTRFQCNPYPAKPLTSAAVSETSPYFLPACTQFIVEFAGDFVTQDNDATHTIANYALPRTAAHPTRYGDITAYGKDGVPDFYIDAASVKHLIWYGMPRNTSGKTTTSYINGDVVPVRDWLVSKSYNSATGAPISLGAAPFEKAGPPVGEINNYADPAAGLQLVESNTGYICAFGPNDPAPSFIRITLTLTDTSGRLPDGLTYQYVFPVPAQ